MRQLDELRWILENKAIKLVFLNAARRKQYSADVRISVYPGLRAGRVERTGIYYLHLGFLFFNFWTNDL